jgi:predicted XRE-type DNA-binding protein
MAAMAATSAYVNDVFKWRMMLSQSAEARAARQRGVYEKSAQRIRSTQRVRRPVRVNDRLRGRVDGFSIDSLIEYLARAGVT